MRATDTATVYLTVSPTGAETVESQISQSSDDAEERIGTGAVDLTSTDIEIGDDPGNNGDQVAGLRFQGLMIPKGAFIALAYLELETDEIDSVATEVSIRAQAADIAATFANVTNNVSAC